MGYTGFFDSKTSRSIVRPLERTHERGTWKGHALTTHFLLAILPKHESHSLELASSPCHVRKSQRYSQKSGTEDSQTKHFNQEECVEASPTDLVRTLLNRGKAGVKKSVLVEGGDYPIAVCIAGANDHDAKLLKATVEAVVVKKPVPTPQDAQHLYDNPTGHAAAEQCDCQAHIKRNCSCHSLTVASCRESRL